MIIITQIAGALAEQDYSLDEITQVAEDVAKRIGRYMSKFHKVLRLLHASIMSESCVKFDVYALTVVYACPIKYIAINM